MRKLKIFRDVLGLRGFWTSVILATRGIGYLFLSHRNMRIIFIVGIITFLARLAIHLNGLDLAILCITITLVFIAEIFNTAIEMIIDITTNKYHTLIKMIKDIAAGVVLITALNAVAVGIILFAKKLIK